MVTTSIITAALLCSAMAVNSRQMSVPLKPNFVPLQVAAPDSSITLTLALPSTDMDGLHSALMDVSDPASPKYGQHLSQSEVAALVGPTPQSVQAVTNWLAQSNLKAEAASHDGHLLRVKVPVKTANELLGANYTEFKHTKSGATVLGTLSYTVPDDVQPHLKYIYPTTQLIPPLIHDGFPIKAIQPPVVNFTKTTTPPDLCNQEIFPQCLQDFYNIPSAPATAAGNSIGISAYLNEFATQDDLNTFVLAFRPDVTTTLTFSVVSVDNGVTSGNGTGEASLDIDYTVGLATDVPATFYSVGEANVFGFIDLANLLLNQTNVPLVLSTSYGFDEVDFQGSEDLAQEFCDVYAQLGARGSSVFYASGDNGVYSFGFDSECDSTTFGPTFPSTCPYLTSVGGTENISPEVGIYFSSGGFSNIFPRPSYQDSAVQAYLNAIGSEFSGLYNSSGRAFPDVSAQANNFIIRQAGVFEVTGGTSASCPTFASVVALLNDRRLNAGQSPLGFINPLLYSQTSVLNDITSGSNPGCGAQGFSALSGWDPVTGLGSPDFNKMASVADSVVSGKTD